MIAITDSIVIPDSELEFTFSRSGGPGGQNVNKVNSKATLRWNVDASTALPDELRQRFAQKFRHRLTQSGDVIITSQRTRDQPKNVQDCCDKLAEMVRQVLHPPKRRRKTKPTRGSRLRRLENKREHSQKKESRRKLRPGE